MGFATTLISFANPMAMRCAGARSEDEPRGSCAPQKSIRARVLRIPWVSLTVASHLVWTSNLNIKMLSFVGAAVIHPSAAASHMDKLAPSQLGNYGAGDEGGLTGRRSSRRGPRVVFAEHNGAEDVHRQCDGRERFMPSSGGIATRRRLRA
jgi:hypothetical protein